MYSSVFRTLVFPVLETIQGTRIKKTLGELQKTQWLNREQLVALQQEKLRALIRHAYDNVPYYHAIFRDRNLYPDDIRTQDDLKKLPVLTKEDIRKSLPSLCAKNIPSSRFIESHSSGSTGEPLRYFVDKNSYSAGWAQTFRCWGWAGYRLGDPYVKISSEPRTTLIKRAQDSLLNTYYLDAGKLTDRNLLSTINSIRNFNPVIIRGYPSFLFSLSKLMEKMQITYTGANVCTTGSMLYPHYRETIENRFNCRIFDAYGGEGTAVSFECEEHNGHHIADEDVIVEFLQENEEVASGELGRIVFTNLNNYAMPFIRYDIKDLGIPDDERCGCGRGLSRMKSIEGRESDILVTPSGKLVMVHFFGVLFREIPGVQQFQIIQNRIDKVTVLIVKNPRFSEEDEQKIRTSIRNELGQETELHISIVEEIPVSGRSGKRRYLISDVPLPF